MIFKSFPTTIYGDIWSNHLDNIQLDAPSLYELLVATRLRWSKSFKIILAKFLEILRFAHVHLVPLNFSDIQAILSVRGSLLLCKCRSHFIGLLIMAWTLILIADSIYLIITLVVNGYLHTCIQEPIKKECITSAYTRVLPFVIAGDLYEKPQVLANRSAVLCITHVGTQPLSCTTLQWQCGHSHLQNVIAIPRSWRSFSYLWLLACVWLLILHQLFVCQASSVVGLHL